MAMRIRRKGHDLPRNHAGGAKRKVDYLEFLRMAKQGHSQTAIAAHFGVVLSVVSRGLAKLAADGFDIPKQRGGQPLVWTPERIAAAAERAAASSVVEVAREHGLSKQRMSAVLVGAGYRVRHMKRARRSA